jgi:integrase
LLDYDSKIIESFIINYVKHLKEKEKLQRMSIQVHLAAIFHFLEMNDFDLTFTSKRKIKRFLPFDESTHSDRPYTTDEISAIWEQCDERFKVIVSLMVSTGMRIGAIHTLQIGDLTPVKYQGSELYKIQIYARAANPKDRYYSLCSFECFNAIAAYRAYRQRMGEGEELKDKSPLIREQFNIDDHLRIQNPRPLSNRTIVHLVEQALRKSGVKSKNVMMSHGLRKNFKTVCEESGMKSLHVEMLMGHREALIKSYMRPKDSDVIEDYVSHAMNALTIEPKQRLQTRVKELESERITKEDLEEIRRQWMIDLQKERALISLSEWNELKAQMNKLRELL